MRALPACLLILAGGGAVLLLGGPGDRSAARGAAVYRELACGQCHAVEGPAGAGGARGSRRAGPALDANPHARSRAWHLAHFRDPRAVLAGSTMPAYPQLFEPAPHADEVRARIARHDLSDGTHDDDGIVTRDEFERSGGRDWDALMQRLDDGDGVLGPSDAAPRAGDDLAALLAWLDTVERTPVPGWRAPPPRPEGDLSAAARGRAHFRHHCAGCHGERADGDGPVAGFFGAHAPRDLRRGEYRRRSTPVGRAPTGADLFATIRDGYGPSMPAFAHLSDAQTWDLVAYLESEHPGRLTRELVVREDAGRTVVAFVRDPAGTDGARFDTTPVVLPEGTLLARAGRWHLLRDGRARPLPDRLEIAGEGRTLVFEQGARVDAWLPGFEPEPVAVPAPPFPYTARSAATGAAVWDALDCASCHGPDGRGDGPSADRTRATPDRILRPADLTRGPHRLKTGTDPARLVQLLHTGMEGAPMPSFRTSLAALAEPDAEASAWHLAHHVLRLAGVDPEE